MEPRLQRRVQRYGWDLAAEHYDRLWQDPLAPARDEVLRQAAVQRGQHVLDMASGTGLLAMHAARVAGPSGRVVAADISERMLAAARLQAHALNLNQIEFVRTEAEAPALDAVSFDVVLCSLGLMYLPDPLRALVAMRRLLRPQGRLVCAVWGERQHCGWATLFPIVDEEVASDVCPLFFALGQGRALARLCEQAGLEVRAERRFDSELTYRNDDDACDAAFCGGPVAMAWSRFDAATRARVRSRYLDSLERWRVAEGYRVPAEFVVVSAAQAQPATA